MIDYFSIIKRGETEQIEFKKTSKLLKEAIISICAFANKHGGQLFFGVKDDGQVLGQMVSDDTLKNIANSVKLNTEPRLFPQVEKINIDGKDCIVVTIEESPLKPHTAFGRPYIRVGASNQQLDQATYAHYLETRYNGYGFDYQTVPKATLKDLEEDSIQHFLELANNSRSLAESLYLPIDRTLEKLALIKNGRLTRAAILLFGKKPGKYFDGQYEVKCGAFSDDKTYDFFTNNREFSGNLFAIFEATFSFVMNQLTRTYEKKGQQGKSKWEISPEIIREAIVNMLIHKDYRQGVKSTIEVRPSFIRFYNAGHLFRPIISEENLLKPHPSKPGNKLIAKTFFWAGLAETWGSGTLKIIQELQKLKKPMPSFKHKDGMFELIIYRN